MRVTDLALRRPVFAIVINLLLVVFGLMAYDRLQLREYPDINPPVVFVQTLYPGAAAQVIETRITQIIEDAVAGIEGIAFIDSNSTDGRSNVNIEFILSRDIDAAAADVRDRVSRILAQLPEEVDPPQVVKANANDEPIIWFNLVSDRLSPMELSDYANRYVVDRLAIVDGVASIRVGGEKRPAMRIWLDREAMAARNVTAADVEAALRRENIELPGGRIESVQREFAVRTLRPYASPADFAALVIRRGGDGHLVRVGDVAKVEIAPVQVRSEFRGNRVPMVGLGIIRQSRANTLDVANAVRAEVENIRKTLPEGVQIIASFDSSVFIADAVNEVYRTLAEAVLLVILVVWLFLGRIRATLIPAVAIPVSLVAALAVLAVLGFSLNLLTLLALVLAIGLVVDDAIVVMENIQRRIDAGEPPLLGAERGARQVVFAVIATTLVLVAVFVPITLLEGDLGRLFTEFAVAVAAAVGFSSVVSLTLTPVMAVRFLRPHAAGKPNKISRIFDRVLARYGRMVAWLLPRRVLAVVVILGAGALTALLFRHLPSEYIPAEDRRSFMVQFNLPEGASFAVTQQAARKVEGALMPLVDSGDVTRANVIFPRSQSGVTDTVNNGMAIVVMRPDFSGLPTTEAMAQVAGRLRETLPGAQALPMMRPGLAVGAGWPVQFVLAGADYAELARWRDALLDKARQNPGLKDIDFDYKETKPQWLVNIQRDRAADLGVGLNTIARTLETQLAGRQVTTFMDRGEEYDVMLEAKPEDKATMADLTGIYVRSETTGQLIPLSSLITVTEAADSAALNRFNRLRSITITANLADGYTLGEALEYLETTARDVLPATARIDYKGQSRDFKEAGTAIVFVLAMALVIIYLVLAAQFESFLHPFVILLTVPLAAFGGLLGLWLAGGTLNIFSQIGLLMLIGLAAKNGILIVEFANQLRDAGMGIAEATVEAARLRLRPILMTSIATVAGAIPLVIATGAGAEARFAIGVVVVAGVLVATFLTLFVIPVLYAAVAQFTGSPEQRARELEILHEQHPDA